MNENRTDEAACCAAEDCQANIVGTSVYIGNHVTDRGIDVYDDAFKTSTKERRRTRRENRRLRRLKIKISKIMVINTLTVYQK